MMISSLEAFEYNYPLYFHLKKYYNLDLSVEKHAMSNLELHPIQENLE